MVRSFTLYGWRIVDPGDQIATFNEHVAADSRSCRVLLTVRDGMTLIRRA